MTVLKLSSNSGSPWHKVNDLYMTNLDRMVWSRPDPHGERPSERDGHCAVGR
jgi:hypothetical protein